MLKLIIAGGRDFNDYELLLREMSTLPKPDFIVCGMAKGADLLGFKYAKENKIPILEYKPDWDNLGKSAGYIRNKEMAKNASHLLAFWDGKSKGTKHMIDTAKNEKLLVRVCRYGAGT